MLGGQLKAAKIEYLTIDDKQLEHQIEKLLQGGSVTGLPLPQGFYSLRQGMLRQKWLLSSLFLGILAICLEYLETFAPFRLAIRIANTAAKFFLALSTATLASVKASTNIFKRAAVFLLVFTIFVPFFIFYCGWIAAHGSCLGAALALVSGTTSRSKGTLFGVPFIINYIVALVMAFSFQSRWKFGQGGYYTSPLITSSPTYI